MPEPYTPAELEAGAEASWANAWDGVPPDLQPVSPPWPEFAAANQENADYFRRKAAQVLRAVLPDHDAGVREAEREVLARMLVDHAARESDGSVDQVVMLHAAELVRAHATTPTTEEDPNA